MSLINDALKKAQRLRTHPGEDTAHGLAAGEPVARREQPRSARSILLLVAAAVVLVVLTAVGTVYLFNRPAAAKPSPVAATHPASVAGTNGPAPAVTLPPITPPKPAAPAPDTKPADTKPAPAVTTTKSTPVPVGPSELPAVANAPATPPPAPTETPAANAAPANATPASASTPEASAPVAAAATTPPAPVAKPDERIQAYVDALKVAAIRPGADPRVMIKDRLYRVNEIVDRTLGVRLLKVATDSLTFCDANGVIYVKYF